MQVPAPPLTISPKGCSPCWWLWASVSLKMRFYDSLQRALEITAEMADRVGSHQVTSIPMSPLETTEPSQQASCKMAHSLVSPPPPSTHSPKGREVCFPVTAGETGLVPSSSQSIRISTRPSFQEPGSAPWSVTVEYRQQGPVLTAHLLCTMHTCCIAAIAQETLSLFYSSKDMEGPLDSGQPEFKHQESRAHRSTRHQTEAPAG